MVRLSNDCVSTACVNGDAGFGVLLPGDFVLNMDSDQSASQVFA